MYRISDGRTPGDLARLAGIVAMAFASGAAGQVVRGFGVDHEALGDAQLEMNGAGEVVASSLGNPGAFGAMFEPGGICSVSTSYHIETETPDDAFVETRYVHEAWTTAIRMDRGVHGYFANPDFAETGAATFGVDVYLDGEIVLQATGLGDGDVFIASDEEWSIFCWTIKCYHCRYHGDEYHWVKVEDEAVSPPRQVTIAGQEMLADQIVFRPEGGDATPSPLVRVESWADGIGTFAIRGAGRGYASAIEPEFGGHGWKGLSHVGIGTAALTSEDGGETWRMSEIDADGALGGDGAKIVMPRGATGWSAQTGPIDEDGVAPDGSSLGARAMATINGVADRQAAAMSATLSGGEIALVASFFGEPDGATRSVDVRLGGELVGTYEVAEGGEMRAIERAWPRLLAFEGAGCAGDCPGGMPAARYGWTNGPALLLVGGELVEGDEVVVRPLELIDPVVSSVLASVELDVAGLDAVTFESESLETVAGCAADLNGDGLLNVLDFVAMQSLFQAGDASADFNGDGALDVLDFVAFQAAFVAGC